MDYVVLEFSETQDAFHFGDPENRMDSNGYFSIGGIMSREIASTFIDFIRLKIQRPILLAEVKIEFKEWIKTI